jgi:hypothetical protein
MKANIARAIALAISVAAFAACDYGTDYGTNPQPDAGPATVSATGDITAKVNEFRALLGEPSNGGTAEEQPTGRREIGWDGAAANPFNNRNDFPANFFNTTVKSGAVFATPGVGFRNDSLRFGEVNAGYAAEFNAFSPTKIFSPIGSNIMDVLFQVAGRPTPAKVTGFGVVFSDVDIDGRTTIEFFNENGTRLAVVTAPKRSDAGGLSFVGAKFPEAVVARVRLTLGTGSLSANAADVSAGGQADVVVTDNFIYGEPRAIQ